MLPRQYYLGVLNYYEYVHWLQIPIDNRKTHPIVGNQDYFSPIPNRPQVQAFDLKPIYVDEHIIVVNKPSGVVSVPGPRRHESIASLAFRLFGKSDGKLLNDTTTFSVETETWNPLTDADNKEIDTMIVHRLDRDTSGVLLFARNDYALKKLHKDFKDKARQLVVKKYIALVCGHWHSKRDSDGIAINEGEIDLPLVRDMEHPPFMCVATPTTMLKQSELKQQSSKQQHLSDKSDKAQIHKKQHQHSGYVRMVSKDAKASLTTYRILSYEYLIDTNQDGHNDQTSSARLLPVTRVELTPVTGRTHQLRVHCAAVGHPIVGDSIYGYGGDGAVQGGLNYDADGASLDVQRDVYNYWMRRQQQRSTSPLFDNSNRNGGDGDEEEECMLCLHAYQLSIFHPLTDAPMMFECAPPF
jgi:23S rRNA-/tRNA-specific pseudouridylate synthase